jgi:hypothetical protein
MAKLLASAWRKVGGLLVAGLLAVLVLSPAVDALICKDDGTVAVQAPNGHVTLAVADDADEVSGHPLGAAGTCPHGHCHHGTSYTVADPVDVATAPATRVGRTLVSTRLPPSSAPPGLDRPPRA